MFITNSHPLINIILFSIINMKAVEMEFGFIHSNQINTGEYVKQI